MIVERFAENVLQIPLQSNSATCPVKESQGIMNSVREGKSVDAMRVSTKMRESLSQKHFQNVTIFPIDFY